MFIVCWLNTILILISVKIRTCDSTIARIYHLLNLVHGPNTCTWNISKVYALVTLEITCIKGPKFTRNCMQCFTNMWLFNFIPDLRWIYPFTVYWPTFDSRSVCHGGEAQRFHLNVSHLAIMCSLQECHLIFWSVVTESSIQSRLAWQNRVQGHKSKVKATSKCVL